MTDNKKDSEYASQIRDYGSLGTEFFSAVLIGTAGGFFIDKWFDTKPVFLIVGLIFGAFAGFRNLYSFIKREEETQKIAKEKAGKKE